MEFLVPLDDHPTIPNLWLPWKSMFMLCRQNVRHFGQLHEDLKDKAKDLPSSWRPIFFQIINLIHLRYNSHLRRQRQIGIDPFPHTTPKPLRSPHFTNRRDGLSLVFDVNIASNFIASTPNNVARSNEVFDEILTAEVFDEILTAVVFDHRHERWAYMAVMGDGDVAGRESFDGDFDGREGLRWQSWEMEMSTAEKGFDGEQLLFDGFYYEFVGASREGDGLDCSGVDVIFQSYEG
ncbi:hypothetical protein Dimus_022216 [Dionaea muscipula]